MDLKERNKEIKSKLSKVYGYKNVSVTGGTGTATGWAYIEINVGERLSSDEMYTEEETALLRNTSKEADKLLQGIEFYTYTDDMSYDHKEYIVQTRFNY